MTRSVEHATPGIAHHGRLTLFGRADVIERVTMSATSPAAPPLVLVTGPAGVGRSSLLAAVRARLAGLAVSTVAFSTARNEQYRPYAVASRLSAELNARFRGQAGINGRRAGAAATAHRLAAALATAAQSRLVVLLDDLQWIDPGSVAVLAPLVRTLRGTSITFVCAVRSPVAGARAGRSALAGLRAAGLAEVVPLRPLRDAEVTALLTDVLHATPSVELRDAVRRDCRGLPAAVLAAVAGYQRDGSLCVVDRHAHLARPDVPCGVSDDPRLTRHLRQLGEPAWPVVKALAVLHPLGDTAVRLVAESAGVAERDVTDVIATLRAEGVLVRGPAPGRWRFRLPLLVTAVAACLGQYERRRLAQLAVTAIWSGDADTDDDRYLPEQLVTAGRLVDVSRAAREMLTRGTTAMLTDGYFARRWLRTAADLLTDPAQRAWALFLYTATCGIQLRFADAVDGARTLLSGYADLLAPDVVLEVEMIYVIALSGTFDTAALTDIADGGWRALPGGDGHRIMARCAALCYLDRWLAADELLRSTADVWRRDDDPVAAYGLVFGPTVAALLGRMDEFNHCVADPTQRPNWELPRHRSAQLSELSRILMAFGELDRSEDLLTRHTLPGPEIPTPDRVITAALGGRWDDALHLARASLATGSSPGYLPAHTVMCRETAVILIARGRLAEARAVLERARTGQPVLLHLLAGPQAELERILGATGKSRQEIAGGLAYAAERGLMVGTDELWLRMTECELASGDRAAALRCAAEVARLADRIDTGRARLCHLLATVAVSGDAVAAAEAVGLARQRSQPFELAGTLTAVAADSTADPKPLLEAYDLYGELGALVPRARLRRLMRDRRIPVPGRGTTLAENERLLAALVTEGLTNRELAIVLGGSEKSAEARLTRLFQRTGYRSRVELATAMLTGEYPG